MRLSDGRRLAWNEWGPPDGRPVLYCTGSGMSGALAFGARAVQELRIRLLAIDRPGLGRSDAHGAKTLESWVADVGEVIAAERLTGLMAAGFSQGAPFALALAAASVVDAVAIVSGQDELAHPAFEGKLDADVARMVGLARSDPADFEERFGTFFNAEDLWHIILTVSSGSDRECYEVPEFGSAIREALAAGFMQGGRGYARDLVNTFSRWPFAVEDITVPVDLWYGGLDTSTVHSPDVGLTLSRRLQDANWTVDPNEGTCILWTRAEDILAQLCERASRATSARP